MTKGNLFFDKLGVVHVHAACAHVAADNTPSGGVECVAGGIGGFTELAHVPQLSHCACIQTVACAGTASNFRGCRWGCRRWRAWGWREAMCCVAVCAVVLIIPSPLVGSGQSRAGLKGGGAHAAGKLRATPTRPVLRNGWCECLWYVWRISAPPP